MASEPLGVTFIVPSGQEATGVYEDDNGIEVFETDAPYFLSDGVSLESPLPVRLVQGSIYFDSLGNPQTALGVNGLTPPVWSPSILFANGEAGAWYDPSDLSTRFQDEAGTVPVTIDGQPVGLMLDKSGNGQHLTQPVVASRPTYRTDGTLHWLEFDGVDDCLLNLTFNEFANGQVTIVSGLQLNESRVGNQFIVETKRGSAVDDNCFSVYTLGGDQPSFAAQAKGNGSTNRSASSIRKDVPILSVVTIVSSSGEAVASGLIIRENIAQTGVNTASQGGGAYNGPLYVGRRTNSQGAAAMNLYGLILRGLITEGEALINSEEWMADKSGVTL